MSLGREGFLKRSGSAIAGVQNVSFDWGGDSIDLTSGEDGGIRVLDKLSGQEQIDISADFILKSDALRIIALTPATSKMLTDITLELPILTEGNTTPATISGNFKLASYSEAEPYKEAVTGSFSLESSGPWVLSAEAA